MLCKLQQGGSRFTPVGQVAVAALLAVVLAATTGSASSVHSAEHAADARSRSLWHDSAPVEGSTPRVRGEVTEPGRGTFGKAGAPSQQQQQQQDQQQQEEQQEQERLGQSNGASPLSFTSSNQYPPVVWSPWEQLAEPHREAILVANSTLGDPEHDLFMWTLPTENGATYEGREVRHTFTMVGMKNVILTQTVLSTGEQHILESYVMVKYVRRELRGMLENDREAFLTVMEVMYRVPTKKGTQTYGPEYKGIDYFVQMHLDGAGTRECDHWHDDAGIMTHHVGYTLLFEQAMQVLDPSIAIPYWEYTIEEAQNMSYYGESVVFSDDWFGEFNPQNDMNTVERGRFAFLPIQQDAWNYVHNSYGLLRTPWNMNANPYVTRHNLTNSETPTSMVSCSSYETCFESSSLAVMNACLNGLTHGPVHIMTGGQWDNEEEDFVAATGYFMLAPLVTKYLWRKGFLRTPEFCLPGEGCVTSCPSSIYESRGMNVYDVLMEVNALAWMAALTQGILYYNSDKDKFDVAGHEDDELFKTAFFKKMLHSFCNPGNVGEMYTSAAPYDPIFWVVHPTTDRMLGWRRMLARHEPDTWAFDETFGYDHDWVVGETGYVCDWTGVEEYSNDMPHCVMGICGGHKEYDLLPFSVKINGERRQYTNAEWYELIYPTNEDLPYMYDQYKWEHCTSNGYDMGTLAQSSS